LPQRRRAEARHSSHWREHSQQLATVAMQASLNPESNKDRKNRPIDYRSVSYRAKYHQLSDKHEQLIESLKFLAGVKTDN
jgi:hypothetical protein